MDLFFSSKFDTCVYVQKSRPPMAVKEGIAIMEDAVSPINHCLNTKEEIKTMAGDIITETSQIPKNSNSSKDKRGQKRKSSQRFEKVNSMVNLYL